MGDGALRALKVAVVVMGVLIVVGVAALGVLIAHRMSGAPRPTTSAPAIDAAVASTILDEPPGTHVASTALAAERLALTLQGGGPDRVVILDLRSGRVVARVGLRP
jgi:hypothetical protein